jgi:nicotinamidase-related amidase
MLNDFLDRWPAAERQSLVRAVEALTAAFAAARRPIVWVRQEFAPDLSDAFAEMRQNAIRITIRGTPGCRVVPELTQRPGDGEIVKTRYSAFFGTDLAPRIAEQAIDTLVLAGINTHACIRVTAIDAYQRDLAVILPREAIGSYDKEHAAVSLRYMEGKIARVLSLHEVAASIAAG